MTAVQCKGSRGIPTSQKTVCLSAGELSERPQPQMISAASFFSIKPKRDQRVERFMVDLHAVTLAMPYQVRILGQHRLKPINHLL